MKASKVKIMNIGDASNKQFAQSASYNDLHEVELLSENVEIWPCDYIMICKECKVCIHTFSCEYVDYLIKLNTCKHIHACVAFISRELLPSTTKCDSNNNIE